MNLKTIKYYVSYVLYKIFIFFCCFCNLAIIGLNIQMRIFILSLATLRFKKYYTFFPVLYATKTVCLSNLIINIFFFNKIEKT